MPAPTRARAKSRRKVSSPANTPSTRSATKRIPVWAGNFVLMTYGTGAIMAVPGHDERDFEFCQKYEIQRSVRSSGRSMGVLAEAPSDDRRVLRLRHRRTLRRVVRSFRARKPVIEMAAYAEQYGFGEAAITFRLKDWGVSRQRYWGTPIPVIHCPDSAASYPCQTIRSSGPITRKQ